MCRQQDYIELIASENFVPVAVLQAVGSVLTNKYAEGYPGKRYYGGCDVVDAVERLAIERAKALFGAEHANVQPHSGSQANQAAYFAALEPGDTVLAMRLEHGGHLTHGLKVNFSGRTYAFHHYCLREDTGRIDYDQVRELGPRAAPAHDRRRRERLPAHHRLRRVPRDRRRGGRAAHGRHGPHRRAGGRGRAPLAVRPRRVGHHHDAQDARRTPRGTVFCREADAAALDKAVFPGLQGGPLEHVIAGKAVCFKLAADSGSSTSARRARWPTPRRSPAS